MKRRSSRILSAKAADAARDPILTRENGQSAAPGLYVIATPIGNARDITLRALDVFRGCDLIVAEDTRVTAKLLAIHGVSRPLSAYNDHNAGRERPRILARLREGSRIALVSDAGTPLISDPGYKLVTAALAEGLPVHSVPGASAILAALTLAGLPTDRFFFAGFLPFRHGERRRMLEALRQVDSTLVVFESPQRLAESLNDMQEILGSRKASIGRELTKFHEEVRRGDLATLARDYASKSSPKGEITIVIGPPPPPEPDFAKAEALLKMALPLMPLRAAVDMLAEALELPRNGLYDRALAIKSADEDS